MAESPEAVALELLYKIMSKEEAPTKGRSRTYLLDTYAECPLAVRDPAGRPIKQTT